MIVSFLAYFSSRHDSLRMSSDFKISFSIGTAFNDSIELINISAAICPSLSSGVLIVVNEGVQCLANSTSSWPITEISSGTFIESSFSAEIKPNATTSLKHITAVGLSLFLTEEK